MFSAGIAFLVGVVIFQQYSELPHLGYLLTLLILPVLLYASGKMLSATDWFRKPVYLLRLLCIATCGFLWSLGSAQLRISNALPAVLEGVDLKVSGYIVSIPVKQDRINRFQFDIASVDQISLPNRVTLPLPMRVRLNWYGSTPDLAVGDQWSLTIRLKAPHGFMNPGGFDYEAWLFSQRIMATGYVRNDQNNKRVGSNRYGYVIPKVRSALFSLIREKMSGSETTGVILALVVGDRQLIKQDQWALFRKTGTSHLVAISGLHIGLIAGFAFVIASLLWKSILLLYPAFGVRIPLKVFQGLMALLLAILYAALAGFSLPTQRALIMLCAVLSAILLRRFLALQSGFGLALILVLLLDPFAVNSPGFWLSFSAVAVLLYVLNNDGQAQTWIRRMIHIQLLLILALMPLSLFWFQYAALSSSLANLVAIPVMSFLVVPMSLLGAIFLAVSEPLGLGLLFATDALLSQLLSLLALVAQWPLGQWVQHKPSIGSLSLAVIGVVLLISPRGLPAKYLVFILLLPLFLAAPARPKFGEAWFTLLDVGQGLAAVVETENHTLVFDTGPKFSDRFDTGSSVVVPFLRSRATRQIDTLIISHSDNDHIGGMLSLLKEYRPEQVLSGEVLAENLAVNTRLCHHDQRWTWDGVAFEILYPLEAARRTGNNASCVLKVTAGAQRLLITGDIEKLAELELISAHKQSLPADILVAPHHGSRTSSIAPFIDAVSPKHTLFAAGYRNRYGFPKQEVIRRYTQKGSHIWVSNQHGAILFKLTQNGLVGPSFYRQQYKRYWHHRIK